ncbi:hypothetical protein [Mechercharimyces sp. CAU 1602]|uniref:hypothetical protein n=1 Tax=Mechercharimyces sp. CAU 1602 TaxID=2973933 RepID=UPI002162FD93|nr:hypothetical protein [Mechercharimyces sp. CAU 1602]MCS1351699.1 hypothetical protein [Mechercharimyces sp. CAU 1602]
MLLLTGVFLGVFGGSQILGAVDEFGPMEGQKLAKEAKDVIAKMDDEDQLVNEPIEKEIDESSCYQSLRQKYPEEKVRAIARNIEQGNAFNRKIPSEYPHNEVYIENSKSPSGYVRLDSYNPSTGKIVEEVYAVGRYSVTNSKELYQ